jgi:Amt family ammonium transporter
MEAVKVSTDTLFILLGAIMVLAMHSGFAFLELGTVRRKNQVNALVKILSDFAVSTIVYFFIGYGVAYGVSFMVGAEQLAEKSGFEVTKFFFLLTFAAAVPAMFLSKRTAQVMADGNTIPPQNKYKVMGTIK